MYVRGKPQWKEDESVAVGSVRRRERLVDSHDGHVFRKLSRKVLRHAPTSTTPAERGLRSDPLNVHDSGCSALSALEPTGEFGGN